MKFARKKIKGVNPKFLLKTRRILGDHDFIKKNVTK